MNAKFSHGPLQGIKVLDASTILAGPLSAQILGDYGAEVIKVEHPKGGDGMRGHGLAKEGKGLWWKMISRNKKTLSLYLGDPEGAEVFKQLAASTDVIIENFRPGTFEKWGLGYDVLSKINPGLIMLRVTGFGQEGPYASRPAFGTLVEAMSGFAHLTGQPENPPTLPAFGLADSIAGIAGAAAVSMALYHRDARGGKGQQVDLDLLTPIMTAVGPSVIYADQLGIDQERTGNRSISNAPRNTYQTADGHWVAISTSALRIAERVMRLVGAPEVIDEPWFKTGRGRVANADYLDSLVGGWIAERPRDMVIEEFERAGAAIGPVYKPSEILEDPQVKARQIVTGVPDEDFGTIRMQNVLWRMSETPGGVRFTGRDEGADSDEILGDLGLSSENIARMRAKGVIS